MHYTITLRGVPVCTTDFIPEGEFVTVPVRPAPAYSTIQPLIRAASAALADVALERHPLAPSDREKDPLRRGAELGRVLELRDLSGALVPTDFIELTEWPGGTPEVAAMLRFRDAHAPVVATRKTNPGSATDALPGSP